MKFGLILMPILLISFKVFSTDKKVDLTFKSTVPATCGVELVDGKEEGGVLYLGESGVLTDEDFVTVIPNTNATKVKVSREIKSDDFQNNLGNPVEFDVWMGFRPSDASWENKNGGAVLEAEPGSAISIIGLVGAEKTEMYKDRLGSAVVTINLSCTDG